MPRHRRTVPALLLSALVGCGAWAGPAAAAIDWTAGPDIPAGQFAGIPDIATDAAGSSTVVWQGPETNPPTTTNVFARRVTRDGFSGSPQMVGPGTAPSVVGSAHGTFMTWSLPASPNELVTSRIEPSGAAEGADLVAVDAGPQYMPQSAVLPNGDTVVAWATHNGNEETGSVFVRRISAGGSSGPAFQIGAVRPDELVPFTRLTVTPDGRPRLAWLAPVPGSPRNAVKVARLTATGELDGPVSAVSSSATSTAPQLASAVSGSNDAVLTWYEAQAAGDSFATRRLMAVRLPASGAAAATPISVAAGLQLPRSEKAVAVTPDGTATIAYPQYSSATDGTVAVRRMSTDGMLGPEQPLAVPSTAKPDPAGPTIPVAPVLPLLAPSTDGTLVAVWAQASTSGVTNRRVMRFESREIAADGTPAAQTTVLPGIVSTGDPQRAPAEVTEAKLTSNGAGVGVIGWVAKPASGAPRHQTAIFDAAPLVLSASIPGTALRGVETTFSVTTPNPAKIASVAWQFGNGSSASGSTVTFTYGRTGSYAVTATVTAVNGTETVLSGTVVVTEPIVGPPGGGGGSGTTPPGGGSTPPGVTPTVRAAAKLKLTKATRTSARITASGTLDRRTSGRLTVTWTQKVGRKTVQRTTKAKIAKGKYNATIKLNGALAKSRTPGKLTVSYAGDADTNKASVSRTLKAPKKR